MTVVINTDRSMENMLLGAMKKRKMTPAVMTKMLRLVLWLIVNLLIGKRTKGGLL